MCELSLLNAEDCKTILKKSLKTDDYELQTYHFLHFHNPLQGLIGDHNTLRIKYKVGTKAEEKSFFVKNISSNEVLRELSLSAKVYEKEAFFYSLLAEFKNSKIDTSFAPEGYFFKPHVVVLEDLSKLGFTATPKREFLDLVHCKRCLETLAKFHAAGIVYERIKSQETPGFTVLRNNESVLQDMVMVPDDTPVTRWMRASIEGLFDLIDLVPETHVKHPALKAKLLELLSVDAPPPELISGLVHGDLWSSNFMYVYSNSAPIQCKLLDYQMLKYGSVELDVVEFLMTNTSRKFRADNFRILVEFYWRKLSEAVGEGVVGCREFLKACEGLKLAGKLHAIIDHSFTFVADEAHKEAMKTDESYRRFLFQDRGKHVIHSYNTNEQFKNVLHDDVLELRDLLFEQIN